MFLLILAQRIQEEYTVTYLHSTMFLLIREAIVLIVNGVVFTFHNVSINTQLLRYIILCRCDLHSTMFLLIQLTVILAEYQQKNLHSTMFLLIRRLWTDHKDYKTYLHSTMFLLIQETGMIQGVEFMKFTFHNVSINTPVRLFNRYVLPHLHSTMFLLIQHPDVGILIDFEHLHSTMFLLIRF